MGAMSTTAMLLVHLATAALAAVPPTIVALAAWRTAGKSEQVSKRNEERLVVVHESVNGERDRLRQELAEARAALAEKRSTP